MTLKMLLLPTHQHLITHIQKLMVVQILTQMVFQIRLIWMMTMMEYLMQMNSVVDLQHMLETIQ